MRILALRYILGRMRLWAILFEISDRNGWKCFHCGYFNFNCFNFIDLIIARYMSRCWCLLRFYLSRMLSYRIDFIGNGLRRGNDLNCLQMNLGIIDLFPCGYSFKFRSSTWCSGAVLGCCICPRFLVIRFLGYLYYIKYIILGIPQGCHYGYIIINNLYVYYHLEVWGLFPGYFSWIDIWWWPHALIKMVLCSWVFFGRIGCIFRWFFIFLWCIFVLGIFTPFYLKRLVWLLFGFVTFF